LALNAEAKTVKVERELYATADGDRRYAANWRQWESIKAEGCA
jgi:hypothetical protein